MEKVRTGWLACACISATMVEESIPPDRNAPSGTSDKHWRLIAIDSRRCNSAIASFSSEIRAACAATTRSRSDQYGCGAGMVLRSPPTKNVTKDAGGSFLMPRQIVDG